MNRFKLIGLFLANVFRKIRGIDLNEFQVQAGIFKGPIKEAKAVLGNSI